MSGQQEQYVREAWKNTANVRRAIAKMDKFGRSWAEMRRAYSQAKFAATKAFQAHPELREAL